MTYDPTAALSRALDAEIVRIATDTGTPATPWTEAERAANIARVVEWTAAERAEFVEHERQMLEHYARLFVHETERDGFMERAAAAWHWSTSNGPGANQLVVAFTRAQLSASTRRTTPFVDLPLVYEWMSEGFKRNKAGPGLIHDEAQFAALYRALPETIRNARAARLLLVRAPTGGLQQCFIDAVATPTVAKLTEPGQVGDGAPGLLAESMRSSLERFLKSNETMLRAVAPQTSAEADALAPRLDAAFAAHIKRTGAEGRKISAALSKRSSERAQNGESPWRLWLGEPNDDGSPVAERFLLRLAEVLWIDEVQPNLGRRAGMVRAIAMDRVLPLMTRQTLLPEVDDGIVRDRKGQRLASITLTPTATLEIVRSGVHALGTVTGHKLLRALVHRSHDSWVRGVHDPRRVVFSGGWAGLMEKLGISDKHHETLKQIAEAGQCIVWETPYAKYGGLWMWGEQRGGPGKPGEVSFVLGDALTPGYAAIMAQSENATEISARIARRFIPELRYEPPMGGARNNDQGPLWTMHRLMLVDFVDHAEELHANGGVQITSERWRELGKAAGIQSASVIERTLDAWVAGESDKAPALLERVADDTWTLAKPHAPERDFIADGGRDRVNGRAGRRPRRRRRKPV